MRRTTGGAALVAGATVVCIFSCRQIVGVGSGGPAPSASACGLPFGTGVCAACASTSCCAESNACASDSMFCGPYEACLGECKGDPACRSRCTVDYTVPADDAGTVSKLSACLVSNCSAECGLACGGFAGYLSMPDAAASCQHCLRSGASGTACADALQCGSSVECDAFWRCILACQTPDCQWACMPRHDAGAAMFRPLYKDFSGSCQAACGYGDYWACTGKITWPAAADTVDWTWHVDDFNGVGVTDASVAICTGCPCSSPIVRVLGDGGTDENGNVTITYPQRVGPSGGTQITCTETTAEGHLTNYGTPGFPGTEPVVSIENSLLPPGAWGAVSWPPSDVDARVPASTGAAWDPAQGIVAVGVFDCLGSPAGGVDVALAAPDGAPWPPADGGTDGSLVARTQSGGPFAGEAVFWNVPPGTGAVALTASAPGVGIVSRETTGVFAGAVSQVGMPPTP